MVFCHSMNSVNAGRGVGYHDVAGTLKPYYMQKYLFGLFAPRGNTDAKDIGLAPRSHHCGTFTALFRHIKCTHLFPIRKPPTFIGKGNNPQNGSHAIGNGCISSSVRPALETSQIATRNLPLSLINSVSEIHGDFIGATYLSLRTQWS